MNGFAAVIRKEFMHLRRDPASLVIALMLPLIQLIIFGFAINFDVRHIPAAIVDLDNSRESRQYVQQLQATQYIDPVLYSSDIDAAFNSLRDGRAKVAVTIPSGFARTMLAGGNPQVGVMVDGSDAQVSLRARFAFITPPRSLPKGSPDVRTTVLFNPDSRTANYMVPALIAVILQIVTVSLTAFSIVREKEQGTLEQLMVTPVGRLALMIGKLVPYACLGLAELFLVFFLSNVVFGVESHGSLIVLTFMSLPFIVASLALGLLISTLAQTQGQALQFSMLITMPSILLSGYIAPRETMPGALYLLSTAFPATHYMQITRGIMVRGAGFWDLLPPLLALLLIATALLALSTSKFRKSIS